MILPPSIYLYNKSLGLTNYNCIKKNKFVFYHTNRKATYYYNAIMPILLWYSVNILQKAFLHAVELVRSICNKNNSAI